MYHFIVRQKLRRAFQEINAGDYQNIVAQFSLEHRHAMFGRHALAGERTSMDSTTRWYARLQRLLPDLKFQIGAIVVAGWPWDTCAVVTWHDTFTLPDGQPASNRGVHVFRLAWGKVRSLEVHCDTAKLEEYCARMAELGIAEAAAAPICDQRT